MKSLYSIFIFLFFVSSAAWSQGTSGTATLITPTAYFDATPTVPTLTTYSLVSSSAQVFPSCAGSQTVYWLRFNIPLPTLIEDQTRAVKITVNPTGFTPVIDFFDSSVTWRECITGNILRTNATTNTISHGVNYFVRISSTTPAAGASFQIGIEWYPVAVLRDSNSPFPFGDTDGYNFCDPIRRNNLPASIQAHRWHFTPVTTPNSGSCTFLQNGNTTLTPSITSLSCICYGITYNVQAEVQVDNHWCGIGPPRPLTMQAGPTTNIITATNSILPMSGQIQASNNCSGASYQWEFSSQNGTTLTATTTSPAVILENVPCIRFNRIYQVRVRVTQCNTVGPWCGIAGANSAPLILFTQQIPVIPVPDFNGTSNDFCWAQRATSAFVDVDFYPGVSNYIFQFTRVQGSSPFTPIANPKIVYSTTSGCLLSFAQVSTNSYFRIGIKAGIGYSSTGAVSNPLNCPEPQQSGDWCPWCYFSTSPAPAPIQSMALAPNEFIRNPDDTEATIREEIIAEDGTSIEVYGRGDQRYLLMDLQEKTLSNNAMLQLYNLNGQMVFDHYMGGVEGVSALQIELPAYLPTGVYVAKIAAENTIKTHKFFLPRD